MSANRGLRSKGNPNKPCRPAVSCVTEEETTEKQEKPTNNKTFYAHCSLEILRWPIWPDNRGKIIFMSKKKKKIFSCNTSPFLAHGLQQMIERMKKKIEEELKPNSIEFVLYVVELSQPL